MSEYRIHRKGSSRKSPRGGRRRRRSSVRSMGSYGAKDDDEEDLLKMLEEEYQKAMERSNSSKRRKRRKRSSEDLGDGENDDEDDGDEEGDEDEEEEEEEDIDQEELLGKIQHCKDLIEGVKRQTWAMSKKLQVQKSARAYVERFEGKLSRGKGYQQRGKELMKRLERSWNNFTASLVPWEMKIKRIESHFGSVVASYFTFLRWLLWVSVWLAAMPTCFIIIPEVTPIQPCLPNLRLGWTALIQPCLPNLTLGLDSADSALSTKFTLGLDSADSAPST
ncbi:hypothetical protein RRG08_052938 [Elysia crispata]|uniref:Uncharacterized protein n=1 Tax=Elysia crispata TaxID=231223 RepID=A0AAE1BEH6_9GAST|nr:hypothetical protein RRG08_052938 [Elysia crispata]